MRTPILRTDLSAPFNSVASYLGRHWPDGKLKDNQSREVLSTLMGYNSTHEVYKTAETNTLPEIISLDDLKKAMFTRGLKLTSSNPQNLHDLLNRLPYRKLSFYTCTPEFKIDQMKSNFKLANKMILEDEFHGLMTYTSPAIFCKMFDRKYFPHYRQAVRYTKQGYEVFDKTRVEQLTSIFDNLPLEVMAEQGIDQSSLINDYIEPNIWVSLEQHIEKMIQNEEWDMPLGYSVYIANTSKSNAAEDVFLIGKGVYEAVVPRIFMNKREVYEGIATLLKGMPIKPQTERLPTLYNVRSIYHPKESEKSLPRIGIIIDETNQDRHKFNLHGQEYVKIETIKPYPQGWQEAIKFKPDESFAFPNLLKQIESLIPLSTAEDSIQISRKVLTSQNRSELKLRKMTHSQWGLIINPSSVGTLSYTSTQLAHLLDEDFTREEYKQIGESVIKHYPELDGVFFHDVLGVIYESSRFNYYGGYFQRDDELPLCTERESSFLINVAAGVLTGEPKFFYDSSAYTATCLVLVAWFFNEEWSFANELGDSALAFLGSKIKLIQETISIHQHTDSFLKALLLHEGKLHSKNDLYTYHSAPAEPKRESDNNVYLEAFKRSRKVASTTIQLEQSLEGFHKRNTD